MNYILERERERGMRPCKNIPVGSANNDISNVVVVDVINQSTWNINAMEDHLM